jgi:hypothetical protein
VTKPVERTALVRSVAALIEASRREVRAGRPA